MSYIAKNGRLYTSGASEALTLLDDKFSVNKSYSKGDSCIYNDYLWKFTSDKPAGEWDSSVVEQCRIMDFVNDINGRLSDLIKVKSFTKEPNQINGEYQLGIDVSMSGYVPMGVVGFDINNRFNTSITSVLLVGNTVIFKGFTSDLTTLTPKATVLFFKA